jgi:hypothetical protein
VLEDLFKLPVDMPEVAFVVLLAWQWVAAILANGQSEHVVSSSPID